MFFKNLKFAFNIFKKNKAGTAINVLGLAVGISATIVIALIVQYDYSFDKWQPQKENIYRINTLFGDRINPGISIPTPAAIKENIPGIETVAHFAGAWFDNAVITEKSKRKTFTQWGKTVFADENYFKIFPHQWLAGNATSLSQLNNIVLSKSEAERFFGNVNLNQVIGKTITFNDSINLTVAGIVADLKEHTDFDNKNFVSLKTFMETPLKNSLGTISWGSVNSASNCFLLLNKSANIANINTQLKNMYEANQKDFKYLLIGVLQPLSDVHFNTDIDGSVSKSSLRNLVALAFVLLLLAVINFVNLSTAQSTLRAKEIGIRKTFGGSKKQIVYQFLTETFLVTLGATLLAVMLSPVWMYIFKEFIPEGLNTKALNQPLMFVFLAAVVVVVTFLAGLYPAFVLSKFRPMLVMKEQVVSKGKSRSIWVRQTLTVSQFVIAQVFLVVVFVMGKQIRFMLNKDLGFRKDAIVSFYIPDGFSQRSNSKKFVLMNELKQMPDIQNITVSSGSPTRSGYNTGTIEWYAKSELKTFEHVHTRVADENYINLFGIHLLDGKNIHIDTSAKIADVLINETLLHKMGFQNPHDAIGQYLSGGSADSSQIVGVVKDFSTMSLHNPVSPTAIFADNGQWGSTMSVLLNAKNPDSWKPALNKTEKLFNPLYPNTTFNYTFYDEAIKKLYTTDMRISSLLKWTTGLAVFISCLGLLGLVSFMANQRTKEIGIRKVLGASVMQIISLLSRSLIKLVALASVIAFPLAWYFSHKWLEDFAFKTTLSWWIFLISGIGMLVIALTVLCLRTIKAAMANPAKSIKTE
jgi:ABC-type antimicrobial peptide transport system permease subunit